MTAHAFQTLTSLAVFAVSGLIQYWFTATRSRSARVRFAGVSIFETNWAWEMVLLVIPSPLVSLPPATEAVAVLSYDLMGTGMSEK